MDKQIIVNASDMLNELFSELDPVQLAGDNLIVDVALKLIELRNSLGLKQRDIAKQCGVSQVMVSKLESGDNNTSLRTLAEYVKKIAPHHKIEFTIAPEFEGMKYYGFKIDNPRTRTNSDSSYSEVSANQVFSRMVNDELPQGALA